MPAKFLTSTDYLDQIAAADFSPTAAIRHTLNGKASPLPTNSTVNEREQFVRSAMRSAAGIVTSYLGRSAEVATTASNSSAGNLLIVDPDRIVALGHDPSAASDYVTGRLLTQAGAGEVLRAAEVKLIRDRVAHSRYAHTYPTEQHRAGDDIDGRYSGAHLAASIAALRGRERVLDEWPGWCGYFAAADASRCASSIGDYATDATHPRIRRVAASIAARLNGWDAAEDPELVSAIDAGEAYARTTARWKIGGILDDADATITAAARHLPIEEEQPPPRGRNGDENPDPRPGNDAHAIPMSEAEEFKGKETPTQVEHVLREDLNPTTDRTVTPPNGCAGSFPILRCPVRVDRYEIDRMRQDARPLIDAVRRVAWDTERPPQWDRAQQTGELDEGAMHRLAAWDDPEVFQLREDEGRGRVAVFLLVDCSGSMRPLIRNARAVAYALAVGFGAHPRYTLKIAGHDVAYHPQRCRLWECKNADSISGLDAHADNADGYAIEQAMRDIEAVEADRRVVLLMADGQPNAHGYGGTAAATHVRRVVDAGAARGTQFLALGIEGAMRTFGRSMFGPRRFVSLPDTRSAGPLLARMLARVGQGGGQ